MSNAAPFPLAPRSARRFRPAPLAASMALLWSGATIAAPGEPVLDWIETHYDITEPSAGVQVPVGWMHVAGDPAITARYLLNERLVLTRAVQDGEEQSGTASLEIDEAGDYELIVELCDAEGCSRSEPVWITVTDASGERWLDDVAAAEVQVPSYEEAERIVTETAERLARDGFVAERGTEAAGLAWGTWLASFVAQSALDYGLGMGFDALAEQLGFGGPDLAQQLADIDRSLEAIRDELRNISLKIDVGNAQSDFRNEHSKAALAAQNINNIAMRIAKAAASADGATQFQLESWAKDNADNVGALRSFLTDDFTSAVKLMLARQQRSGPRTATM